MHLSRAPRASSRFRWIRVRRACWRSIPLEPRGDSRVVLGAPLGGRSPMLLSVNPNHPEPRKIRRAVDALEAGEAIGSPTDTVYGVGCDLLNKRATERLYQIKQMDRSQ